MTSLTPLSKGLIGLAVIGTMASAVWNLALKDRWGDKASAATAISASPSPSQAPGTHAEPAPNSSTGTDDLAPAEHAAQGRKFMESGDFAQARAHLERAVQGGDAGAACHLGEMTLKGQGGITADQDAAAKLFQLAQSRNTICFAPGQ